MEPQTSSQNEQIDPAPTTTQHPTNKPAEDPGKIMAIIGLVVGFFVFAPIGLVLSILARKKSKTAQFKNTIAVVGIWINGILSILSLLLIAFVVIVIMLNRTP